MTVKAKSGPTTLAAEAGIDLQGLPSPPGALHLHQRAEETPLGINRLEFARSEGLSQIPCPSGDRHPDAPENALSRRTGCKGKRTADQRVL